MIYAASANRNRQRVRNQSLTTAFDSTSNYTLGSAHYKTDQSLKGKSQKQEEKQGNSNKNSHHNQKHTTISEFMAANS